MTPTNDSLKQRFFFSLLGPLVFILVSIGGYKVVIQAMAEQTKKNCDAIVILDKNQGILQSEIPELKKSVDRIEIAQTDFQKETRSDIKTILRELASLNNHNDYRRPE